MHPANGLPAVLPMCCLELLGARTGTAKCLIFGVVARGLEPRASCM